MQYPFIRCYNPDVPVPPHCFYMLSKGENAGKVSTSPWANCFVIICPPSQEYYDFYFWLCFGLSGAGSFKVHLRGSVIPFITIPDVHAILRVVAPPIHKDWRRYKQILSACERLEKLKSNLAQQIIATRDLQNALLKRYLTVNKEGML